MPLSYEKTVAALKAGDRLMITHPHPEKLSERTTYGLVDCGKNVGIRTYRKLVENLAPVKDGLFGADTSQTFEWRD